MNKIIITLVLIFTYYFSIAQVKEFSVEVSGNGTPIFLIPGLGCDKTVWDDTVEHLKSNFECHAFTLAGFAGQKPLNSELQMETIKLALEKYILAHSNKNAILIGHSIGGFYSLQIAIDLQENLEKLIIVDALPFWAKALNPNTTVEQLNYLPIKDAIQPFLKMDAKSFEENQQLMIGNMVTDNQNKLKIVKWSVDSDRKTFATAFQELFRKDLRQEITKIKTKTLVLGAYKFSEYAPIYTYEMAKNTYIEQYKNLTNVTIKVIKNSKHFIMYDQKDTFINEIDNFIK